MHPDARPTRRHQNKHAQFSISKILLVPKLLIGCDKQIERVLRRSEQFSVVEVRPAQFKGCLYGVANQISSQRCGCALIEHDSHLVRLERGFVLREREQLRPVQALHLETIQESRRSKRQIQGFQIGRGRAHGCREKPTRR